MTDERRGGLNRAGSIAWSALGVALLVLLAGWAIGKLMAVVLPIAVAVLLATLLRPIATKLEQRRVKPSIAATISVLLAVLLLCGLIALILPPFIAKLADLGSSLEEGVKRVAYSLGESVAGMDRAAVDRQLESAADRGRERLGGTAMAATTSLAGGLASMVLVFFLAFFLVKDGRRMWGWALGSLPRERRDAVNEVGERMWSNLTAYTRGVVFVATVDALLIGAVLLIMGIPLAMPLIVLTWVAAFFPIIGAIVAGAAAVLVALVSGGATDALVVLGAIVVVQQVEGNVLYPVVVGPRLKLHPVVVLVSVAAGGTLAGIPGAFLAVPVATALSALAGYTRERRAQRELAAALPPRHGVMVGNGTT
ncbi:AI-2E family transporter [Solirubrobacter sp. CPCC 204708]|uniref:AI-2E family transporter n=1 Tax=Solirubrobacter deserti TaxID=2282478 RepID=A0ABT4RDU6_9ACTN|nr:AI-2E family transporter [Solirubrobacter deserti]MBE2315958.1 AI-2E family transporter [Solirubrobacter deserti]MDA0136709.1 AI-2E family transporter [Solirubrobacter deserti]